MEASRFFMIRWYISTGTMPASLAPTFLADSAVAVTGGGAGTSGSAVFGAGFAVCSTFAPSCPRGRTSSATTATIMTPMFTMPMTCVRPGVLRTSGLLDRRQVDFRPGMAHSAASRAAYTPIMC